MDIEKITKAVVMGTDDEEEETGLEHVFDFSYTDERGKVYSGKFLNRILTNTMRVKQAVLKASFRNGLPANSFDQLFNYWIDALAHISVSLDFNERPEWAKDFGVLTDDNVIFELFKEVTQHEDRFFGRSKDQKKSTKDGGGAGKSD